MRTSDGSALAAGRRCCVGAATPRHPEKSSEQASDPAAALAAAVTLLARRDFATGELKQKLLARGFEAAAVADTVDELTAAR